MSTFLCPIGPSLAISPSAARGRTVHPFFQGTHLTKLAVQSSFFRGSIGIARFGLGQVPFIDPENPSMMITDLFGRLDGFLYTVADAAVTSAETVDGVTATKQSGDWLSGITNAMELVLKVLKDVLSTMHVPYAYGFAIILLTIIVKGATFPLTKKQVESAMAMQSLAPQIKAIQERYAGDQERIQLETARLYKLSGINPLAGCLPTLLTIPIWIGLYRALSNVADEGLLSEGFFWIPSLSGPTTIAARQTGGGTSWLFPFIDGHPPLGWPDTFAYLVLPLLLVLSQYISIQIMQPTQSDDPNVKNSQAITKFLPLMIGYFSLSVPSGLSLYWFTNNILTTAQQVWLRKFRGAQNNVKRLSKDQFQIPKVTPKASTAVVEKEDKVSPEVPHRGERFRQLKEQETQRRTQREEKEERKKAEGLAAKKSQVTDAQGEEEVGGLESQGSRRSTASLNSGSAASSHESPRLDSFPVNGNNMNLEASDGEPVNARNVLEDSDDSKNKTSDLHPDKHTD